MLRKITPESKAQLGGMASSVLAISVAVIVLVLSLVIIQELRDTQTVGTEAHSAANDSLVGLGEFSDFITIIVLAVVAGIVLSIIFGVFGGMGGGRRR